jgi:hypothetical protein
MTLFKTGPVIPEFIPRKSGIPIFPGKCTAENPYIKLSHPLTADSIFPQTTELLI